MPKTSHAEGVQKLRTALYERAKREPELRFYSLYDKVYREDVLAHSYALCRANRGAAGPDGVTFEDIEQGGGPGSTLAQLVYELRTKEYTSGPVRRVYIPKANGGERPLGIPNIRDRVVAMAVKLVLEPIFEAEFDADSYGFRPGRDAHQALAAIRESIADGMPWLIDADVSKCFDTIPHDKLLRTVASRVVKVRIRDAIRAITRLTFLSLDELISKLNVYIRGAREYFCLAEPRTLWRLDRYVFTRIARWSRHKHDRRFPDWSLGWGGRLYRERGLASWWRPKKFARATAQARS